MRSMLGRTSAPLTRAAGPLPKWVPWGHLSEFCFGAPHPQSPQWRRDTLPVVVAEVPRVKRFEVTVGGLSRSQLMSKLCSRGVRLNTHAETFVGDIDFTQRAPLTFAVTERTVIALGLPTGATLPQIFGAAQHQGLLMCPVDTGPYLRIALHEQEVSPNSVLSVGSAPAGTQTVAALALNYDHEYSKGFYLRVVDNEFWLRGHRCGDDDGAHWDGFPRF